jgi:hypothetical protein
VSDERLNLLGDADLMALLPEVWGEPGLEGKPVPPPKQVSQKESVIQLYMTHGMGTGTGRTKPLSREEAEAAWASGQKEKADMIRQAGRQGMGKPKREIVTPDLRIVLAKPEGGG